MKIDKVYVVTKNYLNGSFELLEMFLDASAAYNKVSKIVEDAATKGEIFEESQDENDHTVWLTVDTMLEIRSCPTNELNQPL